MSNRAATGNAETQDFDLDPDRYPELCSFIDVNAGVFRQRLNEFEAFGQQPGTTGEVARAVMLGARILSELHKTKQG